MTSNNTIVPKIEPVSPTLVEDPGATPVEPLEDQESGDEPMTGAQASYLKMLSKEANDPAAYATDLTKAEASARIDALKAGLER